MFTVQRLCNRHAGSAALSFFVGIFAATLAGNQWSHLRGGIQLAQPTDSPVHAAREMHRLKLTRIQQAPSGFPQAFYSARSWDTRRNLVEDQVANLLPNNWEQALDALLLLGPRRVDPAILSQIFDAGGITAVTTAYESGVPVRQLGDAVRGSLDPESLILGALQTVLQDGEEAALFVSRAWSGDSEVLHSAIASLQANFGSQYIGTLAEQILDAVHITTEVSRHDALELLKQSAPNQYLVSTIASVARRLNASHPAPNPNYEDLAGVSEFRSYLEVETYARLRREGAATALKWALDSLPPQVRKKPLRTILEASSSTDRLAPVLLALQIRNDNPTVAEATALLDTAIEIALRSPHKASPSAYLQLEGYRETLPQLKPLLDAKQPGP